MDVVNVTCEAAAAPPCGPAGDPAAQDAGGGALFEALLARLAAGEQDPAAAAEGPRARKPAEDAADESAPADTGDDSQAAVVPWMVIATLPLDGGATNVNPDPDPGQGRAAAGVAGDAPAAVDAQGAADLPLADSRAVIAPPAAGRATSTGQPPEPVARNEAATGLTVPPEAAPRAEEAAPRAEGAAPTPATATVAETAGDADAPAAPTDTVAEAGRPPEGAPPPVRTMTTAARALARAVQAASAEQPPNAAGAPAAAPVEGRAADALAAGDDAVKGVPGEVRAGVTSGEAPVASAKAGSQSNAAADPIAGEIAGAATFRACGNAHGQPGRLTGP